MSSAVLICVQPLLGKRLFAPKVASSGRAICYIDVLLFDIFDIDEICFILMST